MHRSLVLGLLTSVLVVAGTGCVSYRTPVMPPTGALYSEISAPLSTEFNPTTAVAPRQGTARACSVLGLIAWGDAGIQTAAKNGGLNSIWYADYHLFNVLGVYAEFTIVAHGD